MLRLEICRTARVLVWSKNKLAMMKLFVGVEAWNAKGEEKNFGVKLEELIHE